ncbi:uncharacterized protein [Dermacentor andersoni]|uniref:uncharacterized protein n=1 Tax=Dermacentor andersoni TaxID=34620 RepID=UPI003B3B7FC7
MAHTTHLSTSQAIFAFLLLLCPCTAYSEYDPSQPLVLSSKATIYQQTGNYLHIDPLQLLRPAFCAPSSSTVSSHRSGNLSGCPSVSPFSWHGSSIWSTMAHTTHLSTSQVCKNFPLYAKKSDDPFLLLLPCQQVLCEIVADCFSMALLLLCSGDVETNPGPTTRTEALLELQNLPSNPSEQTEVLFRLLKDLQARSVQSAKGQAELVNDVKAIKVGQKNIETKMECIQKRLDNLEEKTNVLDHLHDEMTGIQASAQAQTTRLDSLLMRVDELEDRSRRNNLIFHGIRDFRESWEQSESRIREALTGVIDSLPDTAIERAHRISHYTPNKCRPIVVKFTNTKIKDKVFSMRAQLKEKGISISEDFSPATRHVRKKLIEYAKSQPQPCPFQLRYTKLIMNKKQFVYDPATDTVNEHAPYEPRDNGGHANSQHVPS